MSAYQELFNRNYGVLTAEEQERIRRCRILIVGCGGIGGTVAQMLARSGMERFILVEFDSYEASNMNRQIGCFHDTMGKNKAEVVRDQILGINPHAEVEVHNRLLSHAGIRDLMPSADVVFPAADDLAFSLLVFRDAQRLGKPALYINPAGTWAHVSIINPDGPPVDDIEGVPRLETYAEYKKMLDTVKYKFAMFFYVPLGGWRIDYFRGHIYEGYPMAQLCPCVWIASSIGAFEVLKLVSGRFKPVATPRYWSITDKYIRVKRIGGFSYETAQSLMRRIMWRLYQTPLEPVVKLGQKCAWLIFRAWFEHRECKGLRKG